jgi:two-component system, NtrC family, response regulator AtoC
MSHSADLYQAFFHTAGDAIFVFDAATKNLVDTNAQALNVTGYRSEEITGLAIDCLFRPQNGLNCPAFSRNPDEAGKLRGYSLRLVRKSGETIAVNVSVTAVKWGDADDLFVTAHTTNPTFSGVSSATENSATWSEHEDFPSIIGQSEKIHGVCRLIGSVAKSEVTVLIQGESGTGKEIVANGIHAHSHRCRGSFVR